MMRRGFSGNVGAGGLLRARYQIFLGILLAVVLPVVTRQVLFGSDVTSPTQYNTAAGGVLALVLGYLAYRRLHVFPGIAAGGYIFTSVSVAFSALAIVLIMLRLDYSRIQFMVSYLVTVVLFILLHLRFDAREKLILGVVPGGRTARLPALDQVEWYTIAGPEVAVPWLHGVVVDLGHNHNNAWDSRITDFVLRGIPVYDVKQAIEQLTGRVEVEHLSENTLGSLNPNHVFLQLKGLVDAILAAVLLVLLTPLLIIVAFVVKLDSPGPALFRQRRTGFRARPFTVYKFRTMRTAQAAESPEEARMRAMTQHNDPRITRLGAFLRRTRIDELPQLFNILKGEMSLIGPRPEAVELTRWYEKEIPFYHYRHIIKPGVTGWAQVNQGHVAQVDEVREKLHLDFYYVKNFSFWLDALIILRTIQTMMTGNGAK